MAPHSRSLLQHRTALIVAAVLLLHGLLLWALQTGLLQRVVSVAQELVVPAEIIVPSLPTPTPKPAAPSKPEARPTAAAPVAAPVPAAPLPTPAAPTPAVPALAAIDAPAAPQAPSGVAHAAPAAPAPVAAAPARLELPSSDADHLHNPKPRYPTQSVSRNEQGTVVLLVLVGVDGRAKEVKLKASSGFDRLDRAAREAVLGWTFVPAKRAGVPEEMWYEQPIPFRLTE